MTVATLTSDTEVLSFTTSRKPSQLLKMHQPCEEMTSGCLGVDIQQRPRIYFPSLLQVKQCTFPAMEEHLAWRGTIVVHPTQPE